MHSIAHGSWDNKDDQQPHCSVKYQKLHKLQQHKSLQEYGLQA